MYHESKTISNKKCYHNRNYNCLFFHYHQPKSVKTAESSCLSKLPFPSQSYLWKNGFRIFVNLAKDFSEAHRGEYCVADWPVSTDVTNRYQKEKE